MGITRSTVRVDQKPTKEQLRQIREIAKKPIHCTGDCPESTPEALAEFAAMAQARRQTVINTLTIMLSIILRKLCHFLFYDVYPFKQPVRLILYC